MTFGHNRVVALAAGLGLTLLAATTPTMAEGSSVQDQLQHLTECASWMLTDAALHETNCTTQGIAAQRGSGLRSFRGPAAGTASAVGAAVATLPCLASARRGACPQTGGGFGAGGQFMGTGGAGGNADFGSNGGAVSSADFGGSGGNGVGDGGSGGSTGGGSTDGRPPPIVFGY